MCKVLDAGDRTVGVLRAMRASLRLVVLTVAGAATDLKVRKVAEVAQPAAPHASVSL